MALPIQNQQYFPTLCVRPSEMKALEELPELTKDKIIPILLLSPWANANEFASSIERFYKAFGNRRTIVDIDRSYSSEKDRNAVEFHKSLVSEGGEHQEWVNLIENNSSFMPVIQFRNSEVSEILNQSRTLQEFGRGRAYRIDLNSYPPLSKIAECIAKDDHDDLMIIIDGGWSNNAEFVAAQIISIVQKLGEYLDDVPLVVSSASFPNEFSDIEGLDSLPIGARLVFDLVRARYNHLELYYSDWGSAKPRVKDGFGSTPRPRIDYPLKRNWVLSRNVKDDTSLAKAARRIVSISEWEDRPKIWGSYMIEKTANGQTGGIKNHRQAIAVRINLHLYTQTNFEADISALSTDEPWSDI